MLDLSSLDQPSDQSWADMVDEELEISQSVDDKFTDSPSSEHTPSHDTAKGADATSKPSTSAAESKSQRDEQPKEEKEKPTDSASGVVWRIPDAKQRQEQKSVLQMLIERRKNLEKLNDEQQQQQQDGGRESYKREQRQRHKDVEERHQSSSGRSHTVDSWRRPIGKYERIPVRPIENNQISQWASYSESLQKEYKEEQEEAKREFIRRFGSKAANDMVDRSDDSNSPKAAVSTPIEIKISADGPSDWADDIPSDDEWPVHNEDMESDKTKEEDVTKHEDELVDAMQKTRLEEDNVIRQPVDEKRSNDGSTMSAVPTESNVTNDSSTPETHATHYAEEKDDIDQKQPWKEVSVGWQTFAENEAKSMENNKEEEKVHQPNDTSTISNIDQQQYQHNDTSTISNIDQQQQQLNDTSVNSDVDQQQQQPMEQPTKPTVHELPGQLKWAAFAHEESQKKTMRTPIIHASPSVSSGTSTSYSSNRDPPQTPDDGTRARSPSCSTSTANSDDHLPSASSPPPPRSTSPLKKKTPLTARSARSQIMSHLFKNEKKARPVTSTEHTVAQQQLQQPPMVESKERQTHVERVHSTAFETSSVTSDHETASVGTSNSYHSATDYSTSSSQQKPININNDRAANSWQLFAREHDTTAQMHRSPRSYR